MSAVHAGLDGTVRLDDLDTAVQELRAGAPGWVATPLATRLRLLHAVKRRFAAEAAAIVDAACAAHGVDPDGPWVGDQWFILAPFAFHLQGLDHVLSRIEAGRDPLAAAAVRTAADGRVTVDVWPPTLLDRALFAGYGWSATVLMPDGVTAAQVRAAAGKAYRGEGWGAPQVALVLAPGNFSSGPAADALSMLYQSGCAAIVKLNPVNAYLKPFLDRIFADFVGAGWLRFVAGGAEVGQYLAHHRGIDRLHLTGSAATYNALVWGPEPDGSTNRAAGTPLLTKPFTAELGGVSPVIVVPGRWSRADIRRQADRIVYGRLQNSGHLCSSTQILIVPKGWEHTGALLEEIRRLMRSLAPSPRFYPGSDDKVQRAIADAPVVETLQPPGRRYLVTGLDPAGDYSLFTDDVFADVLGVVELPAATVAEYLADATTFANDRLSGTLAATILIDPRTAKAHATALDWAVSELRYGAIGINELALIAFGLRYTTWGGFPGHTPESIGSGVGVVGNAFLLEHPQQTIVAGPFRPLLKSTTQATHRGRRSIFRGLIDFRMTGSLAALPGVLGPALRG